MAPPTTASAPPNNTALPSTSRQRGQARRKPNDDAAYAGPSSVGAKRHAGDPPDGDGRVKRKRVEPLLPPVSIARTARAGGGDGETKAPLMDFSTLPQEALHRYLVQHDLVPPVYPSPLTAYDPPPPSTLLNPHRSASRGLSPPLVTPANRPRRPSREQSRRRSSRLVEEEPRGRTPILADVEEVHEVLAAIAQRHFDETVVKEFDTLASFVCALKAKERVPG